MACKNGHLMIIEMLIQKTVEFSIDLNAEDNDGYTAFHNACKNGHFEVVEILMQKSIELEIELNSYTDNVW